MIPDKPGIYWVKIRRRYIVSDPPEGVLSDWTLAQYDKELEWTELGDECGTGERLVEVIGPEVLPPEE